MIICICMYLDQSKIGDTVLTQSKKTEERKIVNINCSGKSYLFSLKAFKNGFNFLL